MFTNLHNHVFLFMFLKYNIKNVSALYDIPEKKKVQKK